MAMTNNEKQRAYRERKVARGLKRFEYWMDREKAAVLDRKIKLLIKEAEA